MGLFCNESGAQCNRVAADPQHHVLLEKGAADGLMAALARRAGCGFDVDRGGSTAVADIHNEWRPLQGVHGVLEPFFDLAAALEQALVAATGA